MIRFLDYSHKNSSNILFGKFKIINLISELGNKVEESNSHLLFYGRVKMAIIEDNKIVRVGSSSHSMVPVPITLGNDFLPKIPLYKSTVFTFSSLQLYEEFIKSVPAISQFTFDLLYKDDKIKQLYGGKYYFITGV